VVGPGRYVARRTDRNRWEVLEKGITMPTGKEVYSSGFDCIDGFSETDIYAVAIGDTEQKINSKKHA
jgi:hypothetical protein